MVYYFDMASNVHLSLSLVFLSLFILFYILIKKRDFYANLKSILPFLISVSVISSFSYLLKAEIVSRYFQSDEMEFILGLMLWILILITSIKIIVFVIFDYFILHKLKIRFIKLIKDIVIIILYTIGILIIFNFYLNIKVTAILATSAVLTVVAGFSLQDILGDLFSGIALNFEDSLKIGDWIRVGSLEGRIEQLRWRAVKIRTIDDVLILLPNQIASKREILNFKDQFALRITMGVSYKDSPDLVISVIQDVLHSVPGVLKKPIPEIYVLSYNDFSIDYDIRYWTRDYGKRNIIESDIRRKIWYAFKRNGIQIPFPIRDVYIRKEIKKEMSFDEVVRRLSNNEILKLIDPPQLATLLSEYQIDRYGKGEVILKDGAEGHFFYYIIEGEVEIKKRNQILNSLRHDDYFGEISVLTGNKATADVIVSAESMILKIPSEKFKEVIEMNEKMAKGISEVIAARQLGLSELKDKAEAKIEKKIDKQSKTIFNRIKAYFNI